MKNVSSDASFVVKSFLDTSARAAFNPHSSAESVQQCSLLRRLSALRNTSRTAVRAAPRDLESMFRVLFHEREMDGETGRMLGDGKGQVLMYLTVWRLMMRR